MVHDIVITSQFSLILNLKLQWPSNQFIWRCHFALLMLSFVYYRYVLIILLYGYCYFVGIVIVVSQTLLNFISMYGKR
jgi:hypothetical protein